MGKFRKKIIMIGCLVTLLIGAIFLYYSTDKRERLTYDKNNTIAIYLEDSSSTDGYKLNNSKTFPSRGYTLNTSKSSCTNGGSLSQDENNKISLQISSCDSCVLYFDKIKINNAEDALKVLGLKMKEGSPNFAEAANTDETADGLYSMVDDSGSKSYYYRGAVENNYVKFGIDSNGNDMYWRIIRFNGDGSMRMQYDGVGTVADQNYTYTRGFALIGQKWNTNYDDTKYVGWMFGGSQGVASTSKERAQTNEMNSDIKAAVDIWYKENIVDTGWHDYIADEIFCNDRSTPKKDVTGWPGDTGLGYAKNKTGYGAASRTNIWNTDTSKVKPIFVCPQDNDKFTVETKNGNGALTYPVGLITADEIVAAGSGKYNMQNISYYLYKKSWYWSFSPCDFNGLGTDIFTVNPNGNLNSYYANDSNGAVLPVINIKTEYINQLEGDGTASNPYHFEI